MLLKVLLKVLVIAALLLVVTLAGIKLLGTFRWQATTQALRQGLEVTQVSGQPQRVHFDEINDLPPPVQRYLRKSLQDGQGLVAGVQMQHQGTFNLSQTTEQWQPFTSDQTVVTQRPGFLWNGRVTMLPGVPIRVHDAYIAGEGILRAALFGLFPLADMQGTGELAKGQLLRFLAEAAWYPTALLPSQGIRWEPAGDRAAQGTLTAGEMQITMLFTFNEQDLLASVEAEARGRSVGSEVIPTPWIGHFWNYAERSGMQIPLDGEVAWVLPEGVKPYWRGRLTAIRYEFAG